MGAHGELAGEGIERGNGKRGRGACLGAAMGGMGVAARRRGSRTEGSGWLLACVLL
jgi:hypothetical protein